jgi:hypothetical protein
MPETTISKALGVNRFNRTKVVRKITMRTKIAGDDAGLGKFQRCAAEGCELLSLSDEYCVAHRNYDDKGQTDAP